MKRFDPKGFDRGDSVTLYDRTNDEFATVLYYYDGAEGDDYCEDIDVFGDGGAYSIITYDVNDGHAFDMGVLSGYETPGNVADEELGDDLWLVVDDANDCTDLDDLLLFLRREHGIDGKRLLEEVRNA